MNAFARYIIPGLVIQAALVGGGYSTGRELAWRKRRRSSTTSLWKCPEIDPDTEKGSTDSAAARSSDT